MCIYMYIYTCMYVYMYICTYNIYIYIYIFAVPIFGGASNFGGLPQGGARRSFSRLLFGVVFGAVLARPGEPGSGCLWL